MRIIRFLSAAALAGVAPLAAQEVERGPVPDWVVETQALAVPEGAGGIMYMRKLETSVRLTAEGQKTFQAQHFALLHPQALQAGNVSLVWNPATGNPIVHRLVVHRDGEVIDVLGKTDFEILRREDQLEQAMLDGLLTAVLRVPDLRVGDELDIAWSLPSHDPLLKDDSFGMLFLADTVPEGRAAMKLLWEKGQKPEYSIPAGLAYYTSEDDGQITVLVDDAPPANTPKDAPPRYGWDRVLQYTDFESWQDLSRRFVGLYDEAATLGPNSPLREEAKRIAAAHSEPKARAQAALELVQQQVRYIYVGLNGGNLRPSDANTTWERRYGDCKGKTALLLSLLREMGIEARPVLVQNTLSDDGLNERLPSPGAFDHVLVQAKIDGETLWLDGTLPVVARMSEEPFFRYHWVLPVTEEGSNLQEVAQAPFTLPQEMGLFEIDARAGFDAPARKVVTLVARGPAGLAQYVQFSALTQRQIEDGFRAEEGGNEWNTIDSVTYRYDEKTAASILRIEGTGPVDWDDEGGGAYDLVLPGGGFSPPPRRGRPQDQDQEAPYYIEPSYSCHATTVRLPEGTSLKNWGYNTNYDTMLYGRVYYRQMEEREDGTIRMVRGSRVEMPEITAERVERDNGRLSSFDNSKAVIEYDPDRVMNPYGKPTEVPAVYEIDWTGSDAPCLPVDMLED